MLDILTAIWCREKYLSRHIVDGSANAPSVNTYRKHFGNLANAYRRIGFTTAWIANRENLRSIRKALCGEIVTHIRRAGGTVEMFPGCNCQLRVNGELNMTIALGRTSAAGALYGQNQWRFGYRSRQKPDLLIVARVDNASSFVRDYYVLPFIFLPAGSWLTVSGSNYKRLDGFRSNSLRRLYELCGRNLTGLPANA